MNSDINIHPTKVKRNMIILISLCGFLLIMWIIFIILYIDAKKSGDGDENEDEDYLSLWNDCEAKNKLIKFMKNISSKKNFVPKEDRIAVFDLDGTLFQETDPTYDDWKIYAHRVNELGLEEDDERKQIAKEIDRTAKEGDLPEDLNMKIAQTYGQLFNSMTLDEYDKYIKNYVNKSSDGYTNMKRGDAFYKPMLELIYYLQNNDFNVYITSGTDRFQVRSVIEGHINIPKSNVIGSDYKVVATNQNGEGYEYEYQNDDEFKFEGEFRLKNLKTNKIVGIIREIGKQPILAFGNSGGDSCMANYVINNNKYESLSFMVLADDTERERGNKNVEKMKINCEVNGWICISMKNDWKTIYGEKVKKKNSKLR
jgi:phosphoglycolate phosphatase-like HAD superfamily hydrolase